MTPAELKNNLPKEPRLGFRRDIFSVKADVRDGAGECHVFMTYSKDKAFRKAREIRMDTSLGLNCLSRIVHPAQWVVDAFLACGNTIE